MLNGLTLFVLIHGIIIRFFLPPWKVPLLIVDREFPLGFPWELFVTFFVVGKSDSRLRSSNGKSSGGWKPDLYFSITNNVSYEKNQQTLDNSRTTGQRYEFFHARTSFSFISSAAWTIPSKHWLIIGNTFLSTSAECAIKFLILLIRFSSNSCSCLKICGIKTWKCCRCKNRLYS